MIYLKNGLEPLNLAYDDEIVQEANGLYQLSFKFPLVDSLWASLKTEAFLVADDVHGEQEFFIFEVAKKDYFIEVYANQVASLLHHYSLSAIGVNRVPGQTVMQALAGGMVRSSPFSFFSDVSSRHTLNLSNLSVMDALAKNKHSIMGQWGGDLIRDKYRVSLLQQGGSENESLFMYKKNIRSIAGVESIKGLKTRLHLRKVNEEKQAISVTVDSPLIGKYSQIYEGTIEVQDQDVVSAEDLRRYGERYFATHLCDIVEESFDIDVEGLPDVAVRLFDTVTVFDERYGLDVRRKITRYVYSPMRGRLKSIGFGKVQTNLGDKMAAIASEVSEQDKAGLEDDFERKLQKEVENMNRVVEREREERLSALNDGIEQVKAKSEEVKATILSEIEGKIAESRQEPYDLAQSARQLAEEARAAAATAKESALARVDEVQASLSHRMGQQIATSRGEVVAAVRTELANRIKESQEVLEGRLRQAQEGKQQELAGQYRQVSQQVAGLASQLATDKAAGERRLSRVDETVEGLTRRFERLQVGGVNLIRGSRDVVGSWYNAHHWQTDGEVYQGLTVKKRSGLWSGLWSGLSQVCEVKEGETYTFSLYAKTSAEQQGVMLYVTHQNAAPKAEVTHEATPVQLTRDWKRVSVTFRALRGGKAVPRLEIPRAGGTVFVAGYKLERGTIPTDWSPHPEDGNGQTETVRQELATFRQTNSQQLAELTQRVERTDGSLSEAKSRFDQTAQGLRTEVQALQSYVNEDGSRTQSMQEYVRTETAKKTDQLRSEIGQGYATKNQLTETVAGVERRIESLQVGGRNYIRNSAAFSGTGWDANQWEGNYTGVWRKEQDRVLNLPVAHHVSGDKSTPIYLMDVSVGETYTFSAYVKKESVGTVYLYLYDNVEEDARTDGGREIRKDNVGNSWQRLSTTFRVTRAGKLKIRFAIVTSDRGGFSVSAFHLEKGTIPTDWSPHPEDGNGQTETVRQELATFRQTNSQQLAELTQRVERTDGSLSEAKSRFDQTAQGLRTEVQALQSYVNEDGSRTQSMQEYVRTETAKKTDQLRSEIGQGYATKNQLTETVAGVERRIESVQTGTATLMDTKIARYAQTVDRNLASLTQQLGDKVATSTFNQGLDRIQQSVTALSGEALKHSEVTITENGVTLGANKTIGANTLSSILTTSPESIQAITDKMVITPHQHNLFPWKEGRVVTDKHEQITGWRNLSLKEGDELLAKFDIHCTNKRGGAFVGIHLYLKYEDDTTAGLSIVVPEAELTTVRKMETRSLVFPRLPKRVKQVAFGLHSSFATTTFYSADVRVKSSAELIVDGSITGRQIKAGAIETGHLKAGSVTAAHIRGDAIEAQHLKVDDAFLDKLTATDALVNKLTAKDVFATAVQAVTIDASQVTSGLLRAKNGNMTINLDSAKIDFNNNATINFNSGNNSLVRRKGNHTAFVHFSDVASSNDNGVGSIYAAIGVTSSGDGVNSSSSGRFAGMRAFRAARGTGYHEAAVLDQLELYGDTILFASGFSGKREKQLTLNMNNLEKSFDLAILFNSVRALWHCWLHWNDTGWRPDNQQMRNAIIGKYNKYGRYLD